MVVSVPEINKYLNRDGLEEYNSLLPHSSGEMQEYVNDWLDAHPEATTTVQDGAITEPKLADKSVSLRTLADDTVHMLKGMMITREISGDILTADDAYSAPPVSLTVEGKSTQDGTPTPDAPVEIQSVANPVLTVCGFNLWDEEWENGNIDTSTGENISGPSIIRSKNYIRVSPNIQYYRKDRTGYDFAYDENKAFIGTFNMNTDKTPANCAYVRFRLASGYGTTYKHDICVNLSGPDNGTYEPYQATTVTLPVTLRSLPDGTKDTLALSYLRPSTREGWAWYTPTLTALVGETTTAATDGITGTVGVDVMSTTGEIADGPTVLYKLATPTTTQLDPIELSILPAPDVTVWADPSTGLRMRYVRNSNLVIQRIEEAIADQ